MVVISIEYTGGLGSLGPSLENLMDGGSRGGGGGGGGMGMGGE